jgi:hypothetical protein
MSIDLFEQLAEREVPPVPQGLSGGVHRRLNRALVALHVVEFTLCVLPFGAWHFSRAVIGFFVQTVSGRFPDDRSPRAS